MKQFMALVLGFLLAGWAAARGDAPPAAKPEEAVKAIRAARDRGLDWLTKNQTKPDIDTKKLRDVVTQSVDIIAKNQSDSGGWWYTMGNKGDHEGSTTVCAVQALVSASNFGIKIDDKVLDLGFAYLKKCQTEEGGFNYKQGDGTNMKEGTAGDVATLGLMKQFDTTVMLKGYQFLLKLTPAAISVERFPYYGHFYGSMGMQLLGQEFKEDKDF